MAHNAVIRQIMVGKGTMRCSDGLGLNLTLNLRGSGGWQQSPRSPRLRMGSENEMHYKFCKRAFTRCVVRQGALRQGAALCRWNSLN